MTDKIFLSKNLKKLAKVKGISPVTLATRTNSNKSTVHNYFSGSLPQTVMTLKKIADYFEVELDTLVFKQISVPLIKERSPEVEGRYEVIIKKIETRSSIPIPASIFEILD